MKKWYTISGILAVISLILLGDTLSFLPRAFPGQADGAGTALYLFGGLIEINDRIPYNAAPNYSWGLCAAAAICFLLTAVSFILARYRAGKRQ